MLEKFTQFFLAFLSPPLCAHCREFINARVPLCEKCKLLIKPIVSTEIYLSKGYSLKVFAIAPYENPLQQLIRAKLYSNKVASIQLGELMAERLPESLVKADYLVPIPLHWTRYAWRGYNQAAVMAQVIAEKYNKKVIHLLSRTKKTLYQAGLVAAARTKNVAEVFSASYVHNHDYHNKNLVIIDDLMTTGSTLKAAGRELVRYKPLTISAFVTCRVL